VGPETQQLDEWQAQLRENQSLNLFDREKALHAVITFISSRERVLKWTGDFPGSWYSRKRSAKGLIAATNKDCNRAAG
jgi:hypothetical protein